MYTAAEAKPLGYYFKHKAMGCRCHAKTHGNPKVCGGMCSRGDGHYTVTATARIEGNRMTRKWLKAVRAGENLRDVEW